MLQLYTLCLPPIDNIVQNEEKYLKIIISGAWNLLGKELEGQTRYKKVQGMLKTRYKKVQVILETRYKKVQDILKTRYKKVQVFILRNIKMFKRKILDEINKWKNLLNIKKRALVIKGF